MYYFQELLVLTLGLEKTMCTDLQVISPSVNTLQPSYQEKHKPQHL